MVHFEPWDGSHVNGLERNWKPDSGLCANDSSVWLEPPTVMPVLWRLPVLLYQWKRILREQGTAGLRAKVSKGPQRLITLEQENQLKKWLQEDATEHGFPDPTWTSRRVRDLIGLKFDVWYHADHVYKILVRLGFSYQKPEKRAIERDEPRITTWKKEVIPEVHRLMEQDHILVFMDESPGLSFWSPQPARQGIVFCARSHHNRNRKNMS